MPQERKTEHSISELQHMVMHVEASGDPCARIRRDVHEVSEQRSGVRSCDERPPANVRSTHSHVNG